MMTDYQAKKKVKEVIYKDRAFLKALKKHKIFMKFVNNFVNDNNWLRTDHNKVIYMIRRDLRSFNWDKTPEGYLFWLIMYFKISKEI